MTESLLFLLLIPYIVLGTAIFMNTFYEGKQVWRNIMWFLLTLIFYIPVLVILGILIILTYIYYGTKRSSR